MYPLLRKSLTGAFIVAGIVAIAILSIGRQPFNRFIEQQIISVAKGQGVNLALKETDVGFRALYARSGEIFIPQALLLLPFQELTVSPHWFAMLLGDLGVSFEAQLAQGSGKFRLVRSTGDVITVDSDLTDAQIAELPQFSSFGISEGILSVKTTGLKITRNTPTSGDMELDLKKLEKPLASRIQVMLGSFPIPLEIPPIRKGSINTKLTLDNGSVTIKSFESISSWGTISGSGDLAFDTNHHLAEMHIKGEVHLSEEGHASFRSFLPLVSQGILKLESTSFTFELSGKPPALKTRFFDLG